MIKTIHTIKAVLLKGPASVEGPALEGPVPEGCGWHLDGGDPMIH